MVIIIVLIVNLGSLIIFYTYACFSWVAFQHFQELDEHISYVATKVCHLGDQLEGVNTPRQRAVEAQKLMKYFNVFLDGELKSDVFTNSEKVSTVRRVKAYNNIANSALIMNYNCCFPQSDFKSLSSWLIKSLFWKIHLPTKFIFRFLVGLPGILFMKCVWFRNIELTMLISIFFS